MRLRTLAVAGLAWLASPLAAQRPLDSFPAPPHRVLLLGTFHFSDPGLDDYRTSAPIDVMSETRQAELEQVLAVLETFRPTKIALEVEALDQAGLDERYAKYLDGRLELSANEVDQLGLRLARRLGLPRVYAIDADRRLYEPYVDPEQYAREHGQAELIDSPWYGRYLAVATKEDELRATMSLGEYLLYLNRPERIRMSHGVYLVGTFGAGVGDEYPGADAKTAWYNRNLRIFANLRRITDQPEERILVIIGAGHLPILRHCVETSPEYELVEPASLVQPAPPGALSDAEVASILRDNTSEITHDGRLGGPGAEVLLRAAERAQFVLLGEPHNTDQVNRLASMLFEELHGGYGFDYFVNEQDGLMMERLTAPATRGRLDAIRDEVGRHPRSLQFSTDEELALLATVGRISEAERPIWGVDRTQDAEVALEALLGPATAGEDRRAIERLLAGLRQANGPRFLGDQGSAFDELLASLAPPTGSREARILETLRISREDFAAYAGEHPPGDPWGFLANRRREELMKTRFLELYRAAAASSPEAPPRALAKLGHWHVRRGLNPGKVPSLGDFLVDVARFNDLDAISVAIEPVNRPGRHWSITDYDGWAPLTSVADPDRWLLVDLRPLRGYVHSGGLVIQDEAEEAIFGFDFLLLLGGTDRGAATWEEGPSDTAGPGAGAASALPTDRYWRTCRAAGSCSSSSPRPSRRDRRSCRARTAAVGVAARR